MVLARSPLLHVLQLVPTLDRSGAEKQMALLATGLPRYRFAVEVAALTRSGPLEADLRAAGIPVTLVGKRLKADPIALLKLARFFTGRRFDVVQTWIFAVGISLATTRLRTCRLRNLRARQVLLWRLPSEVVAISAR